MEDAKRIITVAARLRGISRDETITITTNEFPLDLLLMWYLMCYYILEVTPTMYDNQRNLQLQDVDSNYTSLMRRATLREGFNRLASTFAGRLHSDSIAALANVLATNAEDRITIINMLSTREGVRSDAAKLPSIYSLGNTP